LAVVPVPAAGSAWGGLNEFPAPTTSDGETPIKRPAQAALEADRHNQVIREWLLGYLAQVMPAPGQRPDTMLGPYLAMRKASGSMSLKLMAGDVERAEALAKSSGLTVAECIEIYSQLNLRNTPSWQGGSLLEKGKMKSKKKLKKAGKAAVELYNRPIIPDSNDAQKRAQGFQDFAMMYRATRQQIFNDPRFGR
jgi:hypothetical protein